MAIILDDDIYPNHLLLCCLIGIGPGIGLGLGIGIILGIGIGLVL